MASARQRAAARKNIKKAQAALRGKRRGRSHSKPRKSKAHRRGRMKAFHHRQNKALFPEGGKWVRAFRVLDVLTTGVQGAIKNHGFTKEALLDMKERVFGIHPNGQFELSAAMPHAEGVAVGFIRDKIRSKLGVYRG